VGCKDAKKIKVSIQKAFLAISFHFLFNNHLLKKTFMLDIQLFKIIFLRIFC